MVLGGRQGREGTWEGRARQATATSSSSFTNGSSPALEQQFVLLHKKLHSHKYWVKDENFKRRMLRTNVLDGASRLQRPHRSCALAETK